MLDRNVVEELIDDNFDEWELEIPKDIEKEALVETFCQYVEDDYYEWLKDNLKSFFDHGSPDWNYVKEKMTYYLRK
jgi:hypothetical protein